MLDKVIEDVFPKSKRRDPARIDIVLNKIKEVWMRHPDLRLVQIIMNCLAPHYYYTEDDELMEALERLNKYDHESSQHL